MQELGFILVALAILGYGLISGRVQNSIVTPPMAFVLFGLLIGPKMFGLVGFDLESGWIHLLAELTLILVLFTDAARIDLRLLRREHDLPVRMLLLGLPLTLVLGTFVAVLLFEDLGLWEAAALAAILAPTDAALGQAVVSSPRVPVRIRQALNVESGLNDGIVLPLVLILLSLADAAEQSQGAPFWVRFALLQVTLGPAVGIGVGYLGGKLVELGSRSGWMNHTFQRLSVLGLALLSFGLAELVGGNGFIAAFCAGLALGNASQVSSCLYEFGEAEGQLLTLLIFMILGVVMVPIALDHLSLTVVLYALASLTVVRMIPVVASVAGAGLRPATKLFLAWFGPRGIASILFALLVLERMEIAGREEILVVVVTTVSLSVFLHGASAYPLSEWYAGRVASGEAVMAEHRAVSEMPVRLPFPSRSGEG